MNVYDSLVELVPKLRRYRKLLVAFLTSTGPFVLWLTASPHDAAEVVLASQTYLLSLFGIYQVTNEPS